MFLRIAKTIGAGAIIALIALAVQIANVSINVYSTFFKELEEKESVLRAALEDFIDQADIFHSSSGGGSPVVELNREGLDLSVKLGYETPIPDFPPAEREQESFSAELSHYRLGGYRVEDSEYARATISLLKAAVRESLDDYFKEVEVETYVLGVADGVPVATGIKYKGDLGAIEGHSYFDVNTGEWKRMHLTPGVTNHTNESIAFLRALDVINSLNEVEEIRGSKVALLAETTPFVGEEFRKVIVRIHIKEAFGEEHRELGFLGKSVLEFLGG